MAERACSLSGLANVGAPSAPSRQPMALIPTADMRLPHTGIDHLGGRVVLPARRLNWDCGNA